MLNTALKFSLPIDYDEVQLITDLAKQYTLKSEPSTTASMSLYDTFDWRLFNQNLTLYMSHNQLFLQKLANVTPLHQIEVLSPPVFVEDVTDNLLQERLRPLIKMRALLPLVNIRVIRTRYRILNRDEKTVARIVYETYTTTNDPDNTIPFLRQIWTEPIRGYNKAENRLTAHFETIGFKQTSPKQFYMSALEQVDKTPGDYSAKLNLHLRSDMTADEAIRIILQAQLVIIRHNEPYLAADIDTEFLHDFRVAIRRTRSALSQIKQVFPSEVTARFKKDFSYAGKLSNQLRDLDVYLLNEALYKNKLPPLLQKDIEPLFEHLRQKRKYALDTVVKGVQSARYQQILADWEDFLATDSTAIAVASGAANAQRLAHEMAQEQIYRQYRRIIRQGTRILATMQDEALHDLRLECKKLRYSIEFFTSLFPSKAISLLVKQLKLLQDNLGDFNDLCVQEIYLKDIAQELPITTAESRQVLLAIGSLIGTLYQEQRAVKSDFSEKFAAFSSPDNKQLFKQLFAQNKTKAVS
ncbi:CHAD domain-containing protein [Anaerolineales bacterium HSG6]|nr:CHAD domain-containing protein [Anaerolineales bacterium HSG6]MDM8531537.1 CHAD domain-containing protein [Anaerolineales bacterium HSG25]